MHQNPPEQPGNPVDSSVVPGTTRSDARTPAGWLTLGGGPLGSLIVVCGLMLAETYGWIAPQPASLAPMAGVLVLMAVWWLTDAIPFAATALLPLALFPLFGILDPGKTAACYGDKNVFLYLGGFLVALCVEETGLHRRIALAIVDYVGDSPARVALGFMLATGGLSMWLSNKATTMMMLPIALSILTAAEASGSGANLKNFGVCLCLCVAYGANIGGIATPVGTPTNLVFLQNFERYENVRVEELGTHPPEPGTVIAALPDQPRRVDFAVWTRRAAPVAVLFLFVGWAILTQWLFPTPRGSLLGGRDLIRGMRRELGPLRPAELRVGVIFALTALFWIFREPALNRLPAAIRPPVDDSTIAIAMAVLCFLVPSHGLSGRPLLTWEAAARVPWGILLLFGGGLALAAGLGETKLDQLVGQGLGGVMGRVNEFGMIVIASTGMTFLTEITSNVASTQMALPIIVGVGRDLGIDPLRVMFATTMAASFAFMLPVGTPPNAIVYGTGRLTIREMAYAGFWMNLAGILLVTIYVGLLW